MAPFIQIGGRRALRFLPPKIVVTLSCVVGTVVGCAISHLTKKHLYVAQLRRKAATSRAAKVITLNYPSDSAP